MKHLLMALAMLALTSKAMADSEVIFQKGDACIVNDKRTCVVELDYNDLMIEGKPYMQYLKDKGEKNVDDWKNDMDLCLNQFAEKWNASNKGALQATADKADATPLRLVVKMKKLHLGIAALAVVIGLGSGDAHLNCDVLIYEGNKEVSKLQIEDVSSGSQYTESKRLANIFYKLAARSVKCLKKACKKK